MSRYGICSVLCVVSGVATGVLVVEGVSWWLSLAGLVVTAAAMAGVRGFYPDTSNTTEREN